jgi:hypothetical protein
MPDTTQNQMWLKLLGPANKRMTCPPGALPEPNDLSHVVVASMMRSGTHIMINLLLNNFRNYRHTPLYINLDYYFHRGMAVADLENAGGSIIKTHYPQSKECEGLEPQFESFLQSQKVILVSRNHDQVRASLKRFGSWGREEAKKFSEIVERFDGYWDKNQDCLRVDYDDLINPQKVIGVAEKISEFLELPLTRNVVGPRNKNHRLRILIDKGLTRLFGQYVPRINTGIRLTKS